MIIDVVPMGKPRQTRRDKWKNRPVVLRYHAFRDQVKALAGSWKPGDPGEHIFFRLPMPPSWSRKKRDRMAGKPHEQKPDIDNLLKALFDCFGEDKHIWKVSAEKRWGERGSIRISPGRPSKDFP